MRATAILVILASTRNPSRRSTLWLTVLLLCDSILANRCFHNGRRNNDAESEIRQWLNHTFPDAAFDRQQQGIILTTDVDNSAESTGDDGNSYACKPLCSPGAKRCGIALFYSIRKPDRSGICRAFFMCAPCRRR